MRGRRRHRSVHVYGHDIRLYVALWYLLQVHYVAKATRRVLGHVLDRVLERPHVEGRKAGRGQVVGRGRALGSQVVWEVVVTQLVDGGGDGGGVKQVVT